MTNYRKLIFETLADLPFFTKEAVISMASRYNLSTHAVDSFISRGIKNEEIIRLKRNLYVTKSFFETNKSDVSYVLMLANKLFLSYVSLETALQYYGLFTEAVNIVYTSVTNKTTREFENRLGIFKYRTVNDNLFKDFEVVRGKFEFVIASRPKAVFDYLYFKTDLLRKSFDESIYEDLRIDIDDLSTSERKKLDELIKNNKKF